MKRGFLRHAAFISIALMLTRPLPCSRKELLPGTGMPRPKTHQKLMAEAVVGDADHPCGSQSSWEFRVLNNPAAMEEKSSWNASVLTRVLCSALL